MAMIDYAIPFLFVDGRGQGQVTSIDMVTESGKIPIFTLKDGFAGFSPGPGMVTFNIGFVVPVGGLEENFQRYAATAGRHTIQFGLGPQAYVGEGEFTNCQIGGGTQKATEGSCTWQGQKKELK